MKKFLIITALLAIAISQAGAIDLSKLDPEGRENMENADKIMAMKEWADKLPPQQRTAFVKSAVGAMEYHRRCQKLPPNLRFAMLGVWMSDAVLATKESKGLEWMIESTSEAEFCQRLKPAVEQLKTDFSSRGL